ncbi:MAG: hypothetical protein ABSC05_32335, partial [Candidatus Solibacter sp.]
MAKIWLGLALFWGVFSLYTTWRYGYAYEWLVRLGRPLNPTSLSDVLLLALFFSVFLNGRYWRYILFVGVLVCGSRADTIAGMTFLLLF